CPLWVKADTPESGHVQCTTPCLLWANSGLMQCNNRIDYSITSSAATSSDGGIVRPSALAVLRLITNSNLVGCSIGRSSGLAPLSSLSTWLAARRQTSAKFAA